MFLPVNPIIFVRLQRSHAQLSLLSFVPFLDQTPENAQTKGALEAVCTRRSSQYMARKHRKSVVKSSVCILCVKLRKNSRTLLGLILPFIYSRVFVVSANHN